MVYLLPCRCVQMISRVPFSRAVGRAAPVAVASDGVERDAAAPSIRVSAMVTWVLSVLAVALSFLCAIDRIWHGAATALGKAVQKVSTVLNCVRVSLLMPRA
jgi:hypothetical protein